MGLVWSRAHAASDRQPRCAGCHGDHGHRGPSHWSQFIPPRGSPAQLVRNFTLASALVAVSINRYHRIRDPRFSVKYNGYLRILLFNGFEDPNRVIGDMYKKYGLLGPLQAYNIVYPVESITCSWQASALHPEYSYLPVLGPGGYRPALFTHILVMQKVRFQRQI